MTERCRIITEEEYQEYKKLDTLFKAVKKDRDFYENLFYKEQEKNVIAVDALKKIKALTMADSPQLDHNADDSKMVEALEQENEEAKEIIEELKDEIEKLKKENLSLREDIAVLFCAKKDGEIKEKLFLGEME